MKNLGLTFLFLVLLISLSAQEPVDPNGYNTFYYPSGQKSSEGWLKDGQPEGWWKSYSEEGVLLSEGNRKNHLLDSLWTFYDKEGNKILEINYKEGKKNGPRIQYFKDEYTIENWTMDTLKGWVYTYSSEGWLKRATPYEKGKPHGLEKEYNRNGLITSIKTYFRGVLTRREYINRSDKSGKQGPWKYFWDNGNLRMEGSYLNDKKHGFFKTYDENGNFLAVEKYENDQLIADAKETKTLQKKVAYHPNGKPSITATYYNGKPDGIRREFDSTGKIIKGYLFSDGRLTHEGITDLNGKRQGIWKEFYETGELKSMGRYKNSTPVGEWKFFFPDKTVEISGEYNAKGQKEGEWKWFYPNGNLLMVENYEDGELEGNFVEYDENENEITQGQYIDGQEDGVWLTDVHEPWQCKPVAEVCDVLQIPAFLARQTDLVVAAGETGAVVNVKKGQFMAPEDMAPVVRKIESTGNRRIVLCERGASFGYRNLVADMRSLIIMRALGYPVVMDATHAVQRPGGLGTGSGGDGQYAPALARAAVATGVDGVFMETHMNPKVAKSDAANAIRFADVEKLWKTLIRINEIVKA